MKTEMTSAEATEMMFKIRDLLNDKDLNLFIELTSHECGAKMEDVKFCFDMLLFEFTSDEQNLLISIGNKDVDLGQG